MSCQQTRKLNYSLICIQLSVKRTYFLRQLRPWQNESHFLRGSAGATKRRVSSLIIAIQVEQQFLVNCGKSVSSKKLWRVKRCYVVEHRNSMVQHSIDMGMTNMPRVRCMQSVLLNLTCEFNANQRKLCGIYSTAQLKEQ